MFDIRCQAILLPHAQGRPQGRWSNHSYHGSPAMNSTPACVLIVEDDEINRYLLEKRLKKAGYGAHGVATGAEALARLDRQKYDLILLDVMMPKMNGLQTLEQIRSRPASRDIPVIVVSALNAA